MTAEESLREGNLAESLRLLQAQVRAEPSSAAHRVFLFQLLAVMGAWDRALTQLNVVGELDAAALPMVQVYRQALQCEALRDAVFKGERAPLIFGEPTRWLALLVEALRLDAAGDAQAAAVRDEVLACAEPTAGTIDGAPFEWIADADSRLGPALEVVLNGSYYWVPFFRVKHIGIEAPADLRDRVWTPAVFTWANDGTAAGLIPTRYAGTLAQEDSALWLAWRTEWTGDDANARPAGQRMFTTDAGDYALLDVRSVDLAASAQDAAEGGVGGAGHHG